MTTNKGFTIEVSSRAELWWRYNVTLMCGCFDNEDNRIAFGSADSHIADTGANLAQRPAEIPQDRTVRLDTAPCDHIVLYIYIVPHTLPADSDVACNNPFEAEIAISYGGKKLRTEKRLINQWSGASIELKISSSDN